MTPLPLLGCTSRMSLGKSHSRVKKQSIFLPDRLLCSSLSQADEIDVVVGKDREAFFTSGLTLGKKKCSVIRDSLLVDGDWTMDIRTKSQGGEPTYNISVGKAGKGKIVLGICK